MSEAALQVWEYRDTAVEPAPDQPSGPAVPAPVAEFLVPPGLTEAEVAERIQTALQESQRRWSVQAEEHEDRRQQQVAATLQAFAAERATYFRDVETEVVHLSLAIARKILGREAALDPDLLHALVRIALDRMGAGPAVTLRVAPADLARWQREELFPGSAYRCEVTADPALALGECLVETDMGSAQFGLEAQFKEIEQGMLDLLRLRPPVRAGAEAGGAAEVAAPAGKGR